MKAQHLIKSSFVLFFLIPRQNYFQIQDSIIIHNYLTNVDMGFHGLESTQQCKNERNSIMIMYAAGLLLDLAKIRVTWAMIYKDNKKILQITVTINQNKIIKQTKGCEYFVASCVSRGHNSTELNCS